MSLRGGKGPLLLLVSFVLYILSLLPFFVCDRFRLPIVSTLVMFAADGIVTSGEALRARRAAS